MNKILLISIFIFFKISNSIAFLDQDKILKKINQFLINKDKNLILNINSKIKIPSCYGELEILEKYKNLKTLEIRCLGEKPWKYNLRTNINKDIKEKKIKKKRKKKTIAVIVTVKNLKRSQVLTEKNLKIKYVSHVGSKNTYSKLDNLIGRSLKNPLKEGQIVRERHLVKNWLIKEGQKVKIEHKNGNLIILVDGIALKSGMRGDYLEVRNENSGKVVKGWVKNNKKITIFR